MGTRDGEHLVVGGVARAECAALARDREERHERDALFTAGAHEGVGSGVREVEAVLVLHAHHRRDGQRLGEVPGFDVGDREVPDQPRVAQFGQRAEVLGDRVLPHTAQVHHVEVVAAKLAQVLLDMAAQVLGPGRGAPLPRVVAERPDLGGDDQLVRVRGERAVDQFVRGAQRREVEGRGVDVVDAQLDRAAQHGDRAVAVARSAVVEGRAARQPHRAEPDAVDGEISKVPGARGCRGDLL